MQVLNYYKISIDKNQNIINLFNIIHNYADHLSKVIYILLYSLSNKQQFPCNFQKYPPSNKQQLKKVQIYLTKMINIKFIREH